MTEQALMDTQSLGQVLDRRGAIVGTVAGRPIARHFGSPAEEYRFARDQVGFVLRGDVSLLRIHGRAPRQMLHGILTNRIPDPPGTQDGGALQGEATYGAILTPKGRMVTDLRLTWLGPSEDEGILLAIPAVALEDVTAYFGRYLPPRFAKVEVLDEQMACLSVTGPEAGDVVGSVFGGTPPRGGFSLVDGGPGGGGVLLCDGLEQPSSVDVYLPVGQLDQAWTNLTEAGAKAVGLGVWDTYRVEGGYPQFGVDMDDGTIPIEAGLGELAFDHEKGCYTGQEVIVRIRHRGRVNWHLRALRFGDVTPSPGDELFAQGGEKALGRVTSFVESPAFGEVIGLGYVRREVDVPGELCHGSGDGPRVTVLDRTTMSSAESGPD